MRLAIVEDNPVLRQKLAIALNGEPGIIVEAAFGSAEETLEAISAVAPDVMLVDLGLPGMSGIDLIRCVRERVPGVEIVAHTVFDDKDTIFTALKGGATGYILKGCRLGVLVDALHEVERGAGRR